MGYHVLTCFAPHTGYAVYFDNQRRKSPEFRRSLRRNERRQVRNEKENAAAAGKERVKDIQKAVDAAKDEGFPAGVNEREGYFMEHVQIGEQLAADPANTLEAALAFYKALKVYPTPGDLIGIYDKTVDKVCFFSCRCYLGLVSLRLGGLDLYDCAFLFPFPRSRGPLLITVVFTESAGCSR